MRKSKKTLIVMLCISILFIISLAGCSSGTKETNAKKAKAKASVFEMYNKVTLGMKKDQVDSKLKVTPAENSSKIKGMYDYLDKDKMYGVGIAYNDKNQVYSKTVIYDTHAVIAPYTDKSVTEKQEESIKNGMTYEEVKGILGGEGVECNIGGLPNDWKDASIIRRWANEDGSCIQVVFNSKGKVDNSLFYKGDDIN